jgi:Leucine-rich repeat (LRR) protein
VGTVANVNAASTTITMNGDYSITANFVAVHDLTISSTAGGSVTTPGQGTFTRDAGMVVSLVATPASGYRFVNWTGNVGTIANVNAATTTITMNGDYTITANFVRQYNLTTTNTAGGTVTTPGVGTFTYNAATVVNLVATPSSYYDFVNWTGDVGTIANVNAASTTITMNSHCSITANFEEEEPVTFPDPNLEAAIREAIGKATGDIYQSDLEGLTLLDASHRNIVDLTGLEHCTDLIILLLVHNQISDISPLANLTNLTDLSLSSNQISDISPLANLTSLTVLELHYNQISDISPLASLTNLTQLPLDYNQISDISPLASLTKLTYLGLSHNLISDISPLASLTNLANLVLEDNQISDVSPVANLTCLTNLILRYNQISDISPLVNLTSLTYLYLDHNQISDIESLVNNPGLSQGDTIYLYGNPLSDTSIDTYIPQLEARGVTVYY